MQKNDADQTPSPLAMLEAHIMLNSGSDFIDGIIQGKRVAVLTSSVIKDLYWNFAFSKEEKSFDEDQIAEAELILQNAGRSPTLWQLEQYPVPAGWEIKSREVWMWMAANEWAIIQKNNFTNELVIKEFDKPTADMRSVFEDAYSSELQESDVGYSKLPPEYGEAYVNLKPPVSGQEKHFAGFIDGQCVAIASAVVENGVGGLYSVATMHGFRKCGFGKQISQVAVHWMFTQGVHGVLLQTEADSAVETMYRKLGFKRTFVGLLLQKN